MICATSSSPPLGGAAASWPLPTPGHMANWTSVFRRRASRLLPVISFTMHHGFFEGLPRVDRPSTRRDQPALVGQAPTIAGPRGSWAPIALPGPWRGRQLIPR
jgi:hypothetical protein